METDEIPAEFSDSLVGVWRLCAGLIARDVDYARYVDAIRAIHAELPAAIRDELLNWPMTLMIARGVWRQTPQPALRYALPSLPVPERNATCPCGSGHKYKHCCLPLEREVPTDEANFLPLLLDNLPRKRWRELAGSRVSLDMVIDAVMRMREEQRDKDICGLLEPWFDNDADFCGKREMLFDTLLDAYTELGQPRKKTKLLDRALAVGDRAIRSAAWQRKSTMLSDEGDYPGAWKAFGEAQRADPQSMSLSHLEVTLLLAEGREQEARDRASFWVHRLNAMRDPQLDDLIGFLREVAAHGKRGLSRLILNQDPWLQGLQQLLQTAPPIASQYVLDCSDEETGPLKPKPALKKVLRAWGDVAPAIGHSPAFADDAVGGDGIDRWLPLLGQHPRLWNAFEVLDAITASIRGCGVGPFTEPLVRPVLERAELLLREVLRANHAEGKRFEWGWLENRPALSLLGERIAIDTAIDKPISDAQVARLEWLVRTLNPNDNQGFRHMLVRAYLQGGRVEDALTVCNSYPDDFAAMRYNHALALFASGERDAALLALRDAVDDSPKPLAWLLKPNPKAPKRGQWGVAVGGDEEAWIYRCETLALWEKLGAMDWLRASARAFKKAR